MRAYCRFISDNLILNESIYGLGVCCLRKTFGKAFRRNAIVSLEDWIIGCILYCVFLLAWGNGKVCFILTIEPKECDSFSRRLDYRMYFILCILVSRGKGNAFCPTFPKSCFAQLFPKVVLPHFLQRSLRKVVNLINQVFSNKFFQLIHIFIKIINIISAFQ